MEHFLTSVPPQVWTTILVLLGASGISFVTQVIKKALALEKTKVVQTVVIGISFATAGLQYLLTHQFKSLPPTVLGVHTATLVGVATAVYNYALNPFTKWYANYKLMKAKYAPQINTLVGEEIITPAPNTGVTVTTTTTGDTTVTSTQKEITPELAV